MKKSALSLAVLCALAMSSCKKDWTCTCSLNGTAYGSYTITNETKSDATTSCNSHNTTVGTTSVTCTL
jgi:hypothetical protein